MLKSLITAVCIAGLLTACGGPGGSGGKVEAKQPVKTVKSPPQVLKKGRTYGWKVVARDGKGGESENEIRTFTSLLKEGDFYEFMCAIYNRKHLENLPNTGGFLFLKNSTCI